MRDPKAVRYDPLPTSSQGEKRKEITGEIGDCYLVKELPRTRSMFMGGKRKGCVLLFFFFFVLESPVGSLEPTDERDEKEPCLQRHTHTHTHVRRHSFLSKIAKKCYGSVLYPFGTGVYHASTQ